MSYGSKGELELAVEAHLPNWWRRDASVAAEMGARPDLRPKLDAIAALQNVSTVDVYVEGDPDTGTWRPEREALHDRIVAAMLGSGPPLTDPVAYFTIGPVGAGKTRTLRPIVDADRARRGRPVDSLARVAADQFRERLPEYSSGLGSLVVQDEAFLVTYDKLFPAACNAQRDLVYDTIGRVDGGAVSFDLQLRELRKAGFRIHVLLADCPPDLCRSRADDRALSEGRLVDAVFQDAVHPQPKAALKTVREEDGLIDEWAVFDTSRTGDALPMVDGSDYWRAADDDIRKVLESGS